MPGSDPIVMRGEAAAGGAQWRGHLLALLGYVVLTPLMTWPLILRLDSAVLGPPGDNLEYVWKMWWFKHALLDLHISPFFNPQVFYPFGYPLALSETTTAHMMLGLPLTALWGETVAYNLVMLFSFIISGWGTYWLCRGLGCGRDAAWIAGVAFTFCPYRMAHMGAGHLPLMGTGWIPLFFLFLERLIVKGNWWRGMLAGLFFSLAALSSWYYAVMLGLLGGCYLLLRIRAWNRRLLWLGIALPIAFVLLWPAARPMMDLYHQGEVHYDYSLAYVDRWSASPVDFIYPNAMHPLWGRLLTQRYYQNIHENLLYVGISVLVLAGLGLARRPKQPPIGTFALLGGLAFILALGTTLHYAGQPFRLQVSPKVEYQFSRAIYILTQKVALHKVDYSPLRRPDAIIIPLPTLLLYLFAPFMSAMRVWTRFGIFVMLSSAVLAAWGADRLLARCAGHWRTVAVVGIAFVLLVDIVAMPYPYGYTEVRGQPVDEWLATQPSPSPLIHFPLDKTWYGWMLYPQRVHGQPIAYGYGTFMPKAYREASKVLASWPSQEALDQLREWGIRYLLMGARSYGKAWPTIRRQISELGLQPVAVFEDRPLYHGDRWLRSVPPSPDVPVTELVSGAKSAYLQDEIHVYEIALE